MELAYNKAMNVALQINEPAIVIGADTLVVKDRIWGSQRMKKMPAKCSVC